MRKRQMYLEEQFFSPQYFNNYETLMTLGNGYLGLRAAHEEGYEHQIRGLYIAGLYNNAGINEVSELVNCADVCAMKLTLNGEGLDLTSGRLSKYRRYLDMQHGELVRMFTWVSPAGRGYDFTFRRFVSAADLHVIGSRVEIVPHQDGELVVESGIDGRQTNSGVQHFYELDKRVYDNAVMQMRFGTTESHVEVLYSSGLSGDFSSQKFYSRRRQLMAEARAGLTKDAVFVFEKMSMVYTNRDLDWDKHQAAVEQLKLVLQGGYQAAFDESVAVWLEYWRKQAIYVRADDDFDQQAIWFAQYHLQIMTPRHDARLSVGAKGLTGEGYKGHVFWDTEIFIQPYFLLTQPQAARNFLQYRYDRIAPALEKAAEHGYQGTLFPWESAFDGKEETPEWAAINIRTGQRQRVASSIAEHHLVADIAYSVCQYYYATLDREFMTSMGMELLAENARFWMSRAVLRDNQYHIEQVIGPDEYTEFVDDNAYTNYMVYYTLREFLQLQTEFDGTAEQELTAAVQAFIEQLYLPEANEELIIPQDNSFLTKPVIDLVKYKKDAGKQTILLDYSRDEVNEMQILKQADTVMLFYLLPQFFNQAVVKKNWHFYEERTIHDSSLSKAMYAVVANQADEFATAYRFFKEACMIDLGDDPESSVEGIHAASLGAIWICAVHGFAGISFTEDELRIEPHLPLAWQEFLVPLVWQGHELMVGITHQRITIENHSGSRVAIRVNGEQYMLENQLVIGGE